MSRASGALTTVAPASVSSRTLGTGFCSSTRRCGARAARHEHAGIDVALDRPAAVRPDHLAHRRD